MRDAEGQQLAYVYYENEPGRRSAAKLLKADCCEHRQAARAVAEAVTCATGGLAMALEGWRPIYEGVIIVLFGLLIRSVAVVVLYYFML